MLRKVIFLFLLFACFRPDLAKAQPVQPTPQSFQNHRFTTLNVPPDLPDYQIHAELDIDKRLVKASQKVTYKNRTSAAQTEVVFHVYPKYRTAPKAKLKLAKTLEVLRLGPDEAIDPKGDRLQVQSVSINNEPAIPTYEGEDQTIMAVPLNAPLEPGQSIQVAIDFTLDLPNQWGRWSHHQGITTLVNWYPVLTVPDQNGQWSREPFVPWHQPWHQEAAYYQVTLQLPADQVVASTGKIIETHAVDETLKRIIIDGPPARDFALVCSNRFQTFEMQVGHIKARVLADKKHADNARRALEYMAEVLPIYEEWFGAFPYDEMEVVTSFFGWNGNECSGLVMIDDRVFNLPAAGERYMDHLITHEVAHQWWWNVVGTNGYTETFMDEGLVNSITAKRLDLKYGRNAPLIVWPKGFGWLPSIGREDLRMASYYKWKAQGNGGPVIQDLNGMSNLNALFSLAYDRGGKVVDMINNRMGDDRYFAFLQSLYKKHSFGILHYEELKTELDQFDANQAWPARLDAWLVQQADTDWQMKSVDIKPPAEPLASGIKKDDSLYKVTVEITQNEDLDEPTELAVIAGEETLSIPIRPDDGDYAIPNGRVERIESENADHPVYRITLNLRSEPTQVEVDPDHRLLDTKPSNNVWRPNFRWRLTPAITPVDTSEMFQSYDRPSFIVGPFVDQNARGGVKVGLFAPNRATINGFFGAMPSLDRIIAGGEAKLTYLYGTNWNAGIFYEDGINRNFSTSASETQSGGRMYLRKVLLQSSSVLDDDAAFYEIYTGHGNIFWAGDIGRPTPGALNAAGMRLKINTQAPFWDPVEGRLFEINGEFGAPSYEANYKYYTRWQVNAGQVWTLGDAFGPLENTRFAVRGMGGMAWPQDVNFFRLGSGQVNRALGFNAQNGSAFWLASAEWRFPIIKQLDKSVFDRAMTFDKVSGVLFYDVGETALKQQFRPVVQGVGFGFRVDTVLFGFLERVNLRFDIAQPVSGAKGGPLFWFGFNQVF